MALDRASLDQIYLSDDPGKDELIERIESLDGAFTLDYAEELAQLEAALDKITVYGHRGFSR